MLSRNNSSASNLSAAAAAAALRRASSQKFEEELLANQRRPASAHGAVPSSPRPGLHRRTSSMSERSFRAQAPEDHARKRAASLMDVSIDTKPEKPKRKGSFTIPMSLRSNSQQKKAKGVSPGVIQPLPQQQKTQQQQSQQQQRQSTSGTANRTNAVVGSAAPTERRGRQHKFKTSLRDGARDPRRESAKEREGPMSPTHSAMRLPQHPGIGSAASSIRSFQTDLSSIAEDQPLDYNAHGPVNPKLPAHLFPMKSAMKGGSGPPSIISEAVSEESKSSLGAHDSTRKGKARVSFSDEQEQSTNAVVPAATVAAPVSNRSTKNGAKGDGSLKSAPPVVVGKPTERPASPPISPQVPTVVPPQPTTEEMMTPPTTTQSTIMSQSTIEETQPLSAPTPEQDETPMEEITPPEASIVPNDIVAKEPTLEPPTRTPLTNNVSERTNPQQVTIHVSPQKSTPPKTRLPGAFPDPTPEPTPPSTADSAAYKDEQSDTLGPLRTQNLSTVPEDDLDLQRGLSMRTLALVPTSPKLGSGEKSTAARRTSEESGASEASVYSDAMDDLTAEQKETKVVARNQQKQQNREAMVINGSGAVAGTATAAALLASSAVGGAKTPSPKAPRTQTIPISKPTSPKAPRAQSMPPAKSPPMKTTKIGRGSLSPGTVIPARETPSTGTNRTTLRENGTSPTAGAVASSAVATAAAATKPKPKPIRTSLRASSVPPTTSPPLSPTVSPSARERKPMRMSLRANEPAAGATSADMAKGLMSLPMVERVPSDSSFKRLKPRDQSVTRTTLRSPPQQKEIKTMRRRRDSDSSDEVFIAGAGGRRRSSSIFGRFGGGGRGRQASVDTPAAAPTTSRVTAGSRFADSSDDEELAPPPRGIGRAYEDTESLPPSPGVGKRSSFSQLFKRGGRKDSLEPVPAAATEVGDGHRRSTSSSGTIVSKRTGKEKRFQGLRKLFRIKE